MHQTPHQLFKDSFSDSQNTASFAFGKIEPNRMPRIEMVVFFRAALIALTSIAATGFCLAEPLPVIAIQETDIVATEGDLTNPARLTLVRSGSTNPSLSVNLLIGGTAASGTDYLPIPSPITIPTGQASHEIVIFPYRDSLVEGAEGIVITVDSGVNYSVASPATATVTVFDTQFDAWRPLRFTPAQMADPEISGPSADPDNDSTSNLGEFFADSAPLRFDLGPVAELVEINGQLHLQTRRNPAASALAVQIEESGVLSGWEPLNPQPVLDIETLGGWDYLSFPIPNSGDDRRFWRARISQPPGEVYDYYVDADLGNDSNDGLSPATAFSTIARALVVSNNSAASMGLARGQRHVPPSSNLGYAVKGRFGGYGSGPMPFFDLSLPVSAGDITAHGTHANVYVIEITHAIAPFYNPAGKLTGGPHFGLWWETTATGMVGQYLKPHYSAADTVAAEQFVKDNPGRCFVQKVGSSLPDVRNETSGATLRYTFQLTDSSDPRSGGTLRYACYHSLNFTFFPGASVVGVAFGRNTRKDLSVCATAAVTPAVALPTFRDCAWLDPGCHAHVGPSHWQRCIAYSRTSGSRVAGGSGWHNYTDVFEPRVPVCEDSHIEGFFNACYSHGISQNPVIQSMRARRLRISNCVKCFTPPTCTVPPEFEDIVATGVSYIFNGPRGNLSRFAARLELSAGVTTRAAIWETFGVGQCGEVTDGVIQFGTSSAYLTDYAPNQSDAEAMGSPTLRRVSISLNTSQAGLTAATQQHINYVFEDVVGIGTVHTIDTNSSDLLFDATMVNSYVGPTKAGGLPLFANLDEYQAKVPGAANDVVMFDRTKPATFAGDPLVDPTITGPAEILGKGMGVDPQIILDLPAVLSNVPTLQSMGFAP